MSCDSSSSLDVYFRELLREENYQGNVVTVAFAAQWKGKGMDMTRTQC